MKRFHLLLLSIFISSFLCADSYHLKLADSNDMVWIEHFHSLWSTELIAEYNIDYLQVASEEQNSEEDYADERFFYVICDGEIPCGYLCYVIVKQWQYAFIEEFFLDIPFRGKGIGKEVLKKLESLLIDQQIEIVGLTVLEKNEQALHLYQKMGFEIKHTFVEAGVPGFYMQKKLNF